MNPWRRVLVRWDNKVRNYRAFLEPDCASTTYRCSGLSGCGKSRDPRQKTPRLHCELQRKRDFVAWCRDKNSLALGCARNLIASRKSRKKVRRAKWKSLT